MITQIPLVFTYYDSYQAKCIFCIIETSCYPSKYLEYCLSVMKTAGFMSYLTKVYETNSIALKIDFIFNLYIIKHYTISQEFIFELKPWLCNLLCELE